MSKRLSRIIVAALLLLLLLAVTVLALPALKIMLSEEFQQSLSEWVSGAGIWGVMVLLGIQMLQVVVAFIPGEPVEVVAGLMYGTIGGLFICLAGILLSSAAVFYLVRRLGRSRLEKTELYPKLTQYKFLQSAEKLETMVFILYLIPGTPKDMLVYICALTTLPMRSFLTISTLARIPSVITSTMAGASFANGNYALTVAIFAVTGLAGLLGIAYHNKRFGKEPKEE